MKPTVLLMVAALVSFGCAHRQPPERRIYVISERMDEGGFRDGPGTGGAGAEAYCAELQLRCHTQCMDRAPRYSSIKKGSADHRRDCTSLCLQEFMECVKKMDELERQEQKRELKFSEMDGALSWLREHKSEIAIGTVVVVAGVAFVVATGGAGALLLVPLAL
jgi:hypothetical protein